MEDETHKISTNDPEELENGFNEYDYVMAFKTEFHHKLFPNDFNDWNIKERCAWLNNNLAKFFTNAPESLLNFFPAIYHKADCGRSSVKVPEWMDIDKYSRGQEFVRNHYASIIISKILGIVLFYSCEDVLKPFIISKRSHTPLLGFKRYISTIQRILHWYDGHPWIKGTLAYNDMQFTRKMHFIIREKLCALNNTQIDNASKIAQPWCPDRDSLLKDFDAACPFSQTKQCPFTIFCKSSYRPKGINNADMAWIQCSLIAFVILFPQEIGIHDASDEDIDAFCYMWKCYGYLLGMQDKYNFCRGNLEEIRQRTRDIYRYWITPNLKNVTPEWEHMTRCLIGSMMYMPLISLPYKVVILIITDMLNVNMANTYASLNYAEWINYKTWTFLLRYGMKISSIRAIVNKVIRNIFEASMKYEPKRLAEFEVMEKQLFDFSFTC